MKRLTKLWFIYLIPVICFFTAFSAAAQVQTARNISIISNSNAYWEYLPEGYDSGNETYPLLLCIHGVGSIGNGGSTDLPHALDGLPGNWIRSNSFPRSFTVNGETFKFIVITPQFTNWPNPDNIDKILDYVVSHYRVNINRIYMTGLSMGGGVTWDYAASAYGKRLAAIVPVCGASDLGTAGGRVLASANLPVWATHNDGDDVVPAYYTNNNIAYINQAPAPNPSARKTIFHANSHDAWYATYNPDYKENGMNVYQWMLQYQRGGTSASGNNQLTVPTINQPPRANAGGSYSVTLPTSSLTLIGGGSDADGRIVSYSWSKVSGPDAYRIPDATISNAAIYGMTAGTYVFRLTVTDDKGATASDDATIVVNAATVANQAPKANAGGARSITLPISSLTLLGGGTDTDGRIVSYSWSKISGPDAFRIPDATIPNAAIYSLVQGAYTFRLTVTDDKGATAYDDAMITVKSAPVVNQPPVVNAGVDRVINMPTTSLTLLGSASDADGSIVSYKWNKISGPESYRMESPNAAQTGVYSLSAGMYLFELQATDNQGATGKDTVQVTVNKAPNKIPTATAGSNQTITLPLNSVTLSGTAADSDGSIVSYEWRKSSGPSSYTIANATAAQTTISNLVEGIYQFELSVSDNEGAIAKAIVQITVLPAPNKAPIATAGGNQTVQLPVNTITLKGTGTDSDGTIVAYLWRKISGPAQGTITDATKAQTTITGLVQGTYLFELKVTDNGGLSAADTMQVIVKAAKVAPSANAGNDITIQLPVNTVTLKGSGADVDGTITGYIWNKISGPVQGTIASSTSAQTEVNGLTQGAYQFSLTVTDNDGLTATNMVQVTVQAANQPPAVTAGNDMTITLPVNMVTLSGLATDADGTIVAYSWTKISGPSAGSFTESNQATTTMTGLVQGIYEVVLAATDNQGATGKDTVRITVNAPLPLPNKLPIVSAGADITITLPVNSVNLTGSAKDTDGTITTYQWKKIAGPDAYTIVNANTAQTQVTGLVEGIYSFELSVRDNNGAMAADTMQVMVKAAPNKAPTANAGGARSITLPISSLTLLGSGTDTDGRIVSYSWSKVSGPDAYRIPDATISNAAIYGMTAGTYVFRLTVTDDKGATASDDATIVVNAATVTNQAPKANAGGVRNITLPTSSVTLLGSGTDNDGRIVSYSWSKISGPGSYRLVKENTPNMEVYDMVQGTYTFRLTVTDDKGATAYDDATVTVNAAPNQAPVANAGTDQTIQLPNNTITLNGSGSDADGRIVSYIWTKISGPAAGTIEGATSAQTKVNGLTEGIYVYELKVTDNGGLAATHTVRIIVKAAPNKAPKAYAGSDISITLPVNTIMLSGTGSDEDGTIATYRWTKVSGPAAGTINISNSAQTTITNMVAGQYIFELTVTDNQGALGIDSIMVTVNQPANKVPVANAGTNQTIQLPVNTVTLTGNGTDADGTIVGYQWQKISGPANASIATSNQAKTVVSELVEGTYQFELTVTDNDGASAKSLVNVIVKAANKAPKAFAGNDMVITLPTNSVQLNGTATDEDGTIASYQWTKVSGPAAYTIVSAATANTVVNNLVAGIYQFSLTVTDNQGATHTATVQVTVKSAPVVNQPPVVNAGVDRVINMPTTSLTLLGSASDADGSIVSYKWNKISGPESYRMESPNAAQTGVYSLSAGMYLFELQATDNQGAIGKDTVQVRVNPATNKAPIANAGYDQMVTLPANTITLNGSGIDDDGTIAFYQWIKVSGPQQGTIATATKAQTTVTGLVAGTYQFALTVTDNEGLSAIDTMQLIVNEAPNQAPSAYAGEDQTIALPLNVVTLNGSGNDADGKIVSYRWQSIGGLANVSMSNPNKSAITVSGLKQGIYQFELTVTDNRGAAAKDTVQVIVNEEPLSNIQLSAYPNPVVNDININVQAPVKMAAATRIRIIDMNGNVVYQESYTRGESKDVKKIDVRNLRTGVYFVEVSVGFIKKTLKIVKN